MGIQLPFCVSRIRKEILSLGDDGVICSHKNENMWGHGYKFKAHIRMGEHYFIDSDTYLLLNFSSCCYDAVQQGSGKCNLGFFLVNFVGRIKEVPVPYGTKKKSLFIYLSTNLRTYVPVHTQLKRCTGTVLL